MEFVRVNDAETLKVKTFFHNRLGIPLDFWQGLVFFESNNGVYACTTECASELKELDARSAFSLGVQLFSNWKNQVPSHTAVFFVARHATANKAEVGEGQMENVWAGKVIARSKVRNADALTEGWLAITANGVVVGSGFFSREGLKPLIALSALAVKNRGD